MRIWIDADSCQHKIRRYVLRRANELQLQIFFVANHAVPLDENLIINKKSQTEQQRADIWDSAQSGETKSSSCKLQSEMIVCDASHESADNYIAAHTEKYDMVITRDIPLAFRLVQNGHCVLNDRGASYTKESVAKRLADRNYNMQLAQIGLGGEEKNAYSGKEFDAFVRCFDKEIMRLVRDASQGI